MGAERASAMRRATELFGQLLDVADAGRDDEIDRLTDSPDVRTCLCRLLAAHRGNGLLDTALTQMPSAPDQIGVWKIGEEIGRGGMAVVYRAERDIGGAVQVAAVKLLTVGALAGYGRERFLREQAILARLDHPYIAALLDAGVLVDGTPWLAMALVEGERVDTWCREYRLDHRAILRLFLDICSAVGHAHGNLVVHRDLKPSNILVDAGARVRLLDFGVAGLLDDAAAGSLSTRSVAMTPGYAAPEQWQGEAVGVAADVYALGVILCELLSGQRPAAAHDLDAIVAKALRESPKQRYPSVADLADDVRRYLQRKPVGARRGNLTYLTTRFMQRHKAALAATFVIAMVLTVSLAHGFYQAGKTRAALIESEAVRGFLEGLFETNVPGGAVDHVPTTRELLDQGADRARREFAQSPRLQLRMFLTLGGIYRQMGLYPQARELLDQALHAARDSDNLSTEIGLETRRQRALLDADTGNLEDAAESLLSLLAVHRNRRSNRTEIVSALRELGQVQSKLGNHDDAVALQQEAIALLEQENPQDAKTVASVRNDLGAAFLRAGMNDQAIATLRKSLAEATRALGPIHEDVNTAASNLSGALRREEQYAEAERLMREVVRTDQRIYSAPHPNAAQHLNNLGTALDFQGQPLAARPYLEQSRRMYLALLGERHPHTAIATSNLAGLEYRLGHYQLAESLQRGVLSQFLDTYGTGHYSVTVAQNNLARTLVAVDLLDEARRLATQSLHDKKKLRGNNDRSIAPTLATLAEIELREGRPNEARQLLQQILRLDGMSERTNSVSTLGYQREIARMLCRSGEHQRGLAMLAEILGHPKLASTSAPLQRADALSVRGDCFAAAGSTDEATLAWRASLDLRNDRLPDDYPDSLRIAYGIQRF